MATLEQALQIAAQAHAGQIDKEGRPYILHPLRMMNQLTDSAAQIAAVLHDVVEDTAVTFEDLESAGFSADILAALRCLTHLPDQSYADYIVACKQNPLAVQVKQADLMDNSRLDRNLIQLDRFESYKRRIVKYLVTYNFLCDRISETDYRRLMTDLEAYGPGYQFSTE